MLGRRLRKLLLAAGIALVFGAVAGLLAALETDRARADPLVSASVGATPSGRPQPGGFVGISLEFNWLHAYSGLDPKAVDPVFLALIRNVNPAQTPVLRIGGDRKSVV